MDCFKRQTHGSFRLKIKMAAWFIFIAYLIPRARYGSRFERLQYLCDSDKELIILIRYPHMWHITVTVEPVTRKRGLPINLGLSNASQL